MFALGTLPRRTIEALRGHYNMQLEERLKLGLGVILAGSYLPIPMVNQWTPIRLAKHFRRLVTSLKVTPITFLSAIS